MLVGTDCKAPQPTPPSSARTPEGGPVFLNQRKPSPLALALKAELDRSAMRRAS